MGGSSCTRPPRSTRARSGEGNTDSRCWTNRRPDRLRTADCESMGSLRVLRLVELDVESARHAKVGHEPVSAVRDVIGELHAAAGELPNRLFDVVAVERDVVSARWIPRDCVGGMATKIRLGQIEDQPAAADVGARQTELVAKEHAKRLR